MNEAEAQSKIAELLGDHGSTILRVLKCAELADDLIEEAGIPRSERGIFPWLCPPPSVAMLHDNMYKSFAREMITRFKAGAKPKAMRKITNAEILATMVKTSLAAPLNRSGYALYHRLFTEIMGPMDDVPEPSEQWSGQIDEELERLKRRDAPRPGMQ